MQINEKMRQKIASSQNWHDNGNDYLPFLKYLLGVVVKAYNEFEDRVEHLRHRKNV